MKVDYKAIAMRVGGVGAGAIAANAAYKILPANMGAKIKAVIVLGVGVALPILAGGGKQSKLIESVGDGMIAFGSLALAKEQFNLNLNISGLEEYPPMPTLQYTPVELVETAELAEAVASIEDIANDLSKDSDVIADHDQVAYTDDDYTE